MNKNLIMVGVIIAFLVGLHFLEGSYWRNKFITMPGDTTQHEGPPVIIPQPPETLKAETKPPPTIEHPPIVLPERSSSDSLFIEKLIARVQELQRKIDTLRTPMEGDIADTNGNRFNLSFDPDTRHFGLIAHLNKVIIPRETDISKYLAAVENPVHKLWLQLQPGWGSGVAAGLCIGYDEIGVGRMWITDSPPVNFVTIRFTF